MFLPDNIIKNLKDSGCRDSSIATYDNNMKRIFTKGLKVLQAEIALISERKQDILNYITSLSKTASQVNLLNTIKKIIGTSDPDYDKALNDAKLRHNQAYIYKIPNKPFISLEELHAILPPSDFSTFKNAQTYIIIHLFRHLPAFRQQDFVSLHMSLIDNNPLYPNIINPETMKITITNYKTSRMYGPRVIDIPLPLHQPILNWIHYMTLLHNEPFLVNSKRQAISQQSFTALLKKIFTISTDQIRRIYISEMTSYIMNTYHSEQAILIRKRLARTLCHSLSTQEMLYSTYKFQKKRSSQAFLESLYHAHEPTWYM